ncbi:MAG: choice-of-anchor tandem repeat GloVer-containing protein [Terriglobales bacterium]
MSFTKSIPVVFIHKVLTLAVFSFSAQLLVAARPAQAQTETVLYNFPGSLTSPGVNGGNPQSGLTSDGAGNFYGTTLNGGASGDGVVYELSPNGSGGWNQTVLYNFCSAPGCADGAYPWGPVIFDNAGNLYGTASDGLNGYGVAFKLSPSGKRWTETVLYSFADGTGFGAGPACGLIMDPAGNLYGTFSYYTGSKKPTNIVRTVFELSPSGGAWTEQVIYSLVQKSNANTLSPGLTMDASGNLFGSFTTTIFELSPNGNSGWTPAVIHTFPNSTYADSTPVLDSAGNLYGTTEAGGASGKGTVYKLSRGKTGTWALATLHAFTGGEDGANSFGGIVFDAAGDIYGTTGYGGENNAGIVYELSPVSKTSHKYNEKILWNFDGTNGFGPSGTLILDSAGNLYGTTAAGGTSSNEQYGSGFGVVFEVTP